MNTTVAPSSETFSDCISIPWSCAKFVGVGILAAADRQWGLVGYNRLTIRKGAPIVDQTLDDIEVRVLGSLIEKEITTPDYYPLSLNALMTACNQSSNRDPVLHLDEDTVSRAADSLR